MDRVRRAHYGSGALRMTPPTELVSRDRDAVRVLHVDDDPAFLELATTFLERSDDRILVHTATGVDEAIDRLDPDHIDCIVSDYDMPHQNGIEFLEQVRTQESDLPFILFTGKGSEEIASEAISAGVTDYLQKESGTDQYVVLANRIVNAVEHSRSRESLERSVAGLREIIDIIPHHVYVIDETGQYLLANQALAETYGRTVDELEGMSITDVFDDAQVNRIRSSMEAVLDGSGSSDVPEFVVRDADGQRRVFEPRWLEYTLADDPRAVLGVSVDITRRRAREQDLDEICERSDR